VSTLTDRQTDMLITILAHFPGAQPKNSSSMFKSEMQTKRLYIRVGHETVGWITDEQCAHQR